MSDLFREQRKLLHAKRYAERAEECRKLAKICPNHLKESYLEMADEYEQLAKKAEE